MSLVRFERTVAPIGFVQFSSNPIIGYQDPVELCQPQEWSNGGVLYSYIKGITKNSFLLPWTKMLNTDYVNLAYFHLNIAVGNANSFIYTDPFGAQITCIFLTLKLNFPYADKAGLLRSGQLELLKL